MRMTAKVNENAKGRFTVLQVEMQANERNKMQQQKRRKENTKKKEVKNSYNIENKAVELYAM